MSDQPATGWAATAHTMLPEHTNPPSGLDLCLREKLQPAESSGDSGQGKASLGGAPVPKPMEVLVWQDHRVNYVNYAVRLKNVRDGDG